jgi:hypothetical protein
MLVVAPPLFQYKSYDRIAELPVAVPVGATQLT